MNSIVSCDETKYGPIPFFDVMLFLSATSPFGWVARVRFYMELIYQTPLSDTEERKWIREAEKSCTQLITERTT